MIGALTKPRSPKAFRWVNVTLLLIMAGAMFGLIFSVYLTVESERREREQVNSTTDILNELGNVETAALNAETGQRGYLITLDRRYLEAYLEGKDRIEPALLRLRELVETDMTARQSELLDRIETLSRSKFSEMDDSVRLLEEGRLLDARRAVLSDEGHEVMERLRRAIGEMEDIEEGILDVAAEETARSEARVLPLLLGLVLLLVLAIFSTLRLVARTARAEAEAAQAKALGEARDKADLLARELNHRVKNLFAVILAIVQLSARDKPEAKAVVTSIADRIRALLTAHEVSQGELDRPVASLSALIETSLAPYRSERLQATVEGEEVLLPAARITPLGLVLHELTTNAVKYGAWANGGTIEVTWEKRGGDVHLLWRERGAKMSEQPDRQGFGTMLMTSAARQFNGTVEREFTTDGAEIRITLPVEG